MRNPSVLLVCLLATLGICGGVRTAQADFYDDFDRPDGDDIGNGWVERNPAAFYLANGRVATRPGDLVGQWDNIVHRAAAEDVMNVEASIEVDFLDFLAYTGNPQLHIRIQADTVCNSSEVDSYVLYIDDQLGAAVVGRQRGDNGFLALGVIPLTLEPAACNTYRMRLRAFGDLPVYLTAFVERKDGEDWEVIGSYEVEDIDAQRLPSEGACGFGGYAGDNYQYDNFVCRGLQTCIDIEKQVSVDNGVTWSDADTEEDAVVAQFGTATYRLVVSNECDRDLARVTVIDEALDIWEDVGSLDSGEQRVLTHEDQGFENLLQPNICGPDSTTLSNTGTVRAHDNHTFVSDSDTAWVECCVGNEPPVALCLGQVYVDVDDQCHWSIQPEDYDGGSYDPDGCGLTYEAWPTVGEGEAAVTAGLTVTDPSGQSASCYVSYVYDEHGNVVVDQCGEPRVDKHTMVVPIDNTGPTITIDNPVVVYEMNNDSVFGFPHTWMWPTNILDACGGTVTDNCTSDLTMSRRYGIVDVTPHDPEEVIMVDQPYEGYMLSNYGIVAGATEYGVCLDRENCDSRGYTITIAAWDAPYSLGDQPQEPNVTTATCDIIIFKP